MDSTQENNFNEQCREIIRLIQQSNYIVLAPHKKPDGDAIGSVLGFLNGLAENEGKKAVAYSADPVPDTFSFLKGYDSFVSSLSWQPDLLIGFDYGDIDRLGVEENVVLGSSIVTFDHHPLRSQVGDVCIIDLNVASTTEVLYNFMRSVDWKISAETAQCLLTGIVTDTGGFAYNVREKTLLVAGELEAKGAGLMQINKHVAGQDVRIMNVWGLLLSQMEMDEAHGLVSLSISYEEMRLYDITLDDISGLVGMLNRVAEAHFAVLLVESEPGKVKGSLRSKEFEDFAVAPIAEKLGGGGHKYAAGFVMEGSLEKAKECVIIALQEVT